MGNTATFKCYYHNTFMLVWSFNGGILPSNTGKLGHWPGELVITNVSKNNQGIYKCKGMLKSKYGMDHSQFVARGFLNVTG